MLPQRRNPVILSPLSPSFILSFLFIFFGWWWMSCLTGWKLAQRFLVLSGASQRLSPALGRIRLSDSALFVIISRSGWLSRGCSRTKLLLMDASIVWSRAAGEGHWSGLPCLSITASLPGQKPRQCCSWLRSSLEKKVGRRCSSTSTRAEVAITGQDGDVPREHLPPLLLCYANSSECITLGPLPAAMCVARCVRQLMRHKVSLFMPL